MDISNLINRLNNELDKLNKLKNEEFNRDIFFTNNEHFNDTPEEYLERLAKNSNNASNNDINQSSEIHNTGCNLENPQVNYVEIKPDNETKSLVLVNNNYLMTAQTMFKKTIRFSLKSFLISISLSFLNLFV